MNSPDLALTHADATDAADGDDARDRMLAHLEGAIEEASRKIESGRVYDEDKEKVRIQWIRGLAYAINIYRQLQNDRDLEALAERLDALEAVERGDSRDDRERWR